MKPVETPPAAAAAEPATPAPEPAVQEPAAALAAAQPEAEPGKPATQEEPRAKAATGASAAGANAVCVQVCDRTEKLNCGPLEVCMAACASANDGSVCATEMSTFMSCALKHPVDHWECTEDGVAAIKDAYCDSEQAAVMRCFEKTAG